MSRKRTIWSIVLVTALLFLSHTAIGKEEEKEVLAITHGPYLQHVTETSATIMWFTNKRCVSRVEYGTGENMRTFPQWGSLVMTAVSSRHGLIDANTQLHSIVIPGLEPGKSYRYRVVSKEIAQFEPYEILYGDSVVSEIYTFHTLNPNKESVAFCVINDIHEDAERLDALLQAVPWQDVDTVFLNGDIINHFEKEQQVFDGFLDICVKRFAKETPFVFIRGNHETRGSMARRLTRYIGTREDRYYHAFNHGPVHFIVLDSGEDKPDTHPVYAGLGDFDRYRDQQAEWLIQDVQSEAFLNSSFQIVLCHIPPYGGNNWHGEQYIRQAWGPVFNDSRIDLLICGHTHHVNKLVPDEEHTYPIYINGRDTVLKFSVSGEKIDVTVIDTEGNIRDTFSISANVS